MNICVFGASSSRLEAEFYAAAEKLGALLASAGHSLVFGGGREGLMGAAARGVHSGGGRIIGIAPRFFDEPGILCELCTEFVFTDTMRERKQLMDARADAFAVLPGGIGTFEEFFEMLTLKQLGRNDRAIVLLNTNGYYAPMSELLEAAVRQGFVSRSCLELFYIADTPEELLGYIASYAPQTGDIRRLSDYTK